MQDKNYSCNVTNTCRNKNRGRMGAYKRGKKVIGKERLKKRNSVRTQNEEVDGDYGISGSITFTSGKQILQNIWNN